jgi:hypothetical protein
MHNGRLVQKQGVPRKLFKHINLRDTITHMGEIYITSQLHSYINLLQQHYCTVLGHTLKNMHTNLDEINPIS